MFAFDETKKYVFIKCTYMLLGSTYIVCCHNVITAVSVSVKNRKKNETNKETDSESLSNQPGLRPVLHLRTVVPIMQLHRLQFPSSTPPHL